MKKLILGFVAVATLFGLVNRADAWAKDEETIFSLNNRTNGRVFEISGMSGKTTVTVDGVISATALNYTSTNATLAEMEAGILEVTTSATIQAATSPGTIAANALSSSTTVTGTRSVFANGSVTGGSTNAGVFVAGQISTTGGVTAASATVPTINGGIIAATNKITTVTAAVSGGSTNLGPLVAGGVATTGIVSFGSATLTTAQGAIATNAIIWSIPITITGKVYWIDVRTPNGVAVP